MEVVLRAASHPATLVLLFSSLIACIFELTSFNEYLGMLHWPSFFLGIAALIAIWGVWRPSQTSQTQADEKYTRTKKMRKMRGKTFIAPFPNGWYKLCNSDDLPRGTVKYFQYVGQHFAAYRGEESGDVCIMDAFCPHLGANMAMGGRVCGDTLVCPFHEWKFNQDGTAADIPYYKGEIPKNAKAKTWTHEERYGMVFFWFHADNEPPTWRLPRIPELDDGRAVFRGKKSPQDVHMHVQDWPENGVDYAHFPILHAEMMVPWTQLKVPFIEVMHDPNYRFDPENPHMSYFETTSQLAFRGKPIPKTAAKATIHFIGQCGVVYLQFDIPEVGRIYLVECHTPREDMVLKTDWMWFAESHIPRALVYYVIGNWYSQWHNDLLIWENKVYKRPPIILKGDGPVNQFRRWYSQFYSASSNKVAVNPKCLDW